MSKFSGTFGAKNMEGLISSDFTSGDRQVQTTFKARIDKSSKVVRHRANVAPKWAEGADGEEEQERVVVADKREVVAAEVVRIDPSAPVDRRLALAAKANNAGGEGGGRRRRIHQAEVIIEKQPETEGKGAEEAEEQGGASEAVEDKERDEVQARRARARLLAQQREKEQEAAKKEESGSEEGSESGSETGSSEYETDSEEEEEDMGGGPVMKPVFLSKSQRENRDQGQLRKEEAAVEREAQQKRDKKALSRTMVAENIRRADTAVRVYACICVCMVV